MLSACASNQALKAPDAESARSRPLLAVYHAPPQFQKFTIGSALATIAMAQAGGAVAGGLGGALGATTGSAVITAATDEGVKQFEIQDPASRIRDRMAVEFKAALGLTAVAEPETAHDRSVNSPREYQETTPDDNLVLEVRTLLWGIRFLGSSWNRYGIQYTVQARVIDPAAGKVLALGKFSYREEFEDSGKAPTQAELFADDARMLKDKLAAIAEPAVVELRSALLPQ